MHVRRSTDTFWRNSTIMKGQSLKLVRRRVSSEIHSINEAMSLLLSGSELRVERRCSRGAADTWTVKILEGDNGGFNAGSLLSVRVTSGEADCDRWAVKARLEDAAQTQELM